MMANQGTLLEKGKTDSLDADRLDIVQSLWLIWNPS
jgi:hypothetical protein